VENSQGYNESFFSRCFERIEAAAIEIGVYDEFFPHKEIVYENGVITGTVVKEAVNTHDPFNTEKHIYTASSGNAYQYCELMNQPYYDVMIFLMIQYEDGRRRNKGRT
jgi:hypothetical protein